MNECWYALALAILAPKVVFPEEAFIALSNGRIQTRNPLEFIPDIVAIRAADKTSWTEMAELFGYSAGTLMSMACRWKKGRGRREHVAAERRIQAPSAVG